mmetsp:Transcript_8544/g.14469  ORF Transcript_8544/g.14469 Transcript_8544/m.14469 type:complete len:565 (-) Transcript_8544:345-2039(-)
MPISEPPTFGTKLWVKWGQSFYPAVVRDPKLYETYQDEDPEEMPTRPKGEQVLVQWYGTAQWSWIPFRGSNFSIFTGSSDELVKIGSKKISRKKKFLLSVAEAEKHDASKPITKIYDDDLSDEETDIPTVPDPQQQSKPKKVDTVSSSRLNGLSPVPGSSNDRKRPLDKDHHSSRSSSPESSNGHSAPAPKRAKKDQGSEEKATNSSPEESLDGCHHPPPSASKHVKKDKGEGPSLRKSSSSSKSHDIAPSGFSESWALAEKLERSLREGIENWKKKARAELSAASHEKKGGRDKSDTESKKQTHDLDKINASLSHEKKEREAAEAEVKRLRTALTREEAHRREAQEQFGLERQERKRLEDDVRLYYKAAQDEIRKRKSIEEDLKTAQEELERVNKVREGCVECCRDKGHTSSNNQEAKKSNTEVKPLDKPSNKEVEKGAKPSEKDVNPLSEEGKLLDKDVKPLDKDVKISEKDIKPSDKEVKLSEKDIKPSEKDDKPMGNEVKPLDKEIKPLSKEVHSSGENVKPLEKEIIKPSDAEAKHSDTESDTDSERERCEVLMLEESI